MTREVNSPVTCSTREAAQALGVSVRTVQLWVEDGRLDAWKTPGGHRRILRASVVRLVEQRQSAVPGNGSALRIHLLDRDPAHREALRAALSAQFPAAQLVFSANAFEGLLKIGEQLPDVLIADLGVVGIDNFGMLDTLRRSPQLRTLLVIVCSADEDLLRDAAKRLPPEFSLLRKEASSAEVLRLVHAYAQGRRIAG